MRHALNEIAEWIDAAYLDLAAPYFNDPWELQHRYSDVLTGKTTRVNLIEELCDRPMNKARLAQMDLLLKAQYERQRMFTSLVGGFLSVSIASNHKITLPMLLMPFRLPRKQPVWI